MGGKGGRRKSNADMRAASPRPAAAAKDSSSNAYGHPVLSERHCNYPPRQDEDLPRGWVYRDIPRRSTKHSNFKYHDRYWYSPGLKFRFGSSAEAKSFVGRLEQADGDESAAVQLYKDGDAANDAGGKNGKGSSKSSLSKSPIAQGVHVGNVGYTFRKRFDDGWYTGRVAKIRPGAEGGKDRRCVYNDGDSEDLSLAQLRSLALMDPEVTKRKAKRSSTGCGASKPAAEVTWEKNGSLTKYDASKTSYNVDTKRKAQAALRDVAAAVTASDVCSKRNKKKHFPKDCTSLFTLDVDTPLLSLAKRKLKATVQFDPQLKDPTAGSCKASHGFTCPRCFLVCSSDSRQCEGCGLERYYEAGVAAAMLEECRGLVRSDTWKSSGPVNDDAGLPMRQVTQNLTKLDSSEPGKSVDYCLLLPTVNEANALTKIDISKLVGESGTDEEQLMKEMATRLIKGDALKPDDSVDDDLDLSVKKTAHSWTKCGTSNSEKSNSDTNGSVFKKFEELKVNSAFNLEYKSVKAQNGIKSEDVPTVANKMGRSSAGVRRSQRTIKMPRKVDEIYNYEHIKMSYAKKAKVALSTPEKQAKLMPSCLAHIIPLGKAAESTFNLDHIIPLDKAAESLFNLDRADNAGDRNEAGDSDEDAGKWLEKVAASLGAADTSTKRFFRPIHRSSTASSLDAPPLHASKPSAKDALDTQSCAAKTDAASTCSTITSGSDNKASTRKHDGDTQRQPPDAVLVSYSSFASVDTANKGSLYSLNEISKGNRHGCLVFHKNDPKRRVAEVILEHDSAWVEVGVDGILKRYRSSNLCVLSSNDFKVGDTVPSNFGKVFTKAGTSKKLRIKTMDSPLIEKKLPGTQGLSVEQLFCWFCGNCDASNKMLDTSCHLCNTTKTDKSKRSVLLKIAETAVKGNVKSVEDAMNRVSFSNRPSIPENLVAHLLGVEASSADVAIKSFDDTHYFYWMCGSCTMQNSYKRTTCSACLQGKGGLADISPLLKIAEDAAMNSNTTEEALSSLPQEERPFVPKIVMDTLVTCIFMIEDRNGQHRRCRKPKKEGCNYCEAHFDPFILNKLRADTEESATGSLMANEVDSVSQTSLQASHSFQTSRGIPSLQGIAAITEIMPSFLSKICTAQINKLGWTTKNIENAVLSGEDVAFPLGMKVRNFFPGWGFHDGRIVKVVRKLWSDVESSEKEQRPILVYRLKYNDGDQEDFLHHEISSLRKTYDTHTVSPEAPPEVQIPTNQIFETRFGTVEIIGHKTPPGIKNRKEGGKVVVKFLDSSSKEIELRLLELQKAVLWRIGDTPADSNHILPYNTVNGLYSNAQVRKAPVLEWPGRCPKNHDADKSVESMDQSHAICEGLSLHRKQCNTSPEIEVAITTFPTTTAVNNPSDARPGCKVGMWDPAMCYSHLSWNPYASTVCEICGIDKDDNQVVICDECHSGFHTYCLRPLMVNIPNGLWLCSACSAGRANVQISFEEYSENMRHNYRDIFKYLGLPYTHPDDFFIIHSEAIDLFSLDSQAAVKQRASTLQVQWKHVSFNIGNIKFIRAHEKNDWILPTPVKKEYYALSILSMVAAMKYCGMEVYTTDHIYSGNVNEEMNDPNLEVDEIAPMSRRNLEIFRAFQHNLTQGVLPPVQIIHDDSLGFSVKALVCMPRHTIIGEYLGEVVTMEQSSESNSDSLMVLLDTGDPKTSLIIDPTRAGNIARFLSGVNNRSLLSKRKANVRTRRFFMNGKVHVCLFTSRRVEAGEILNYDYNAGNKGKDAVQWARSGFYDTSNFF